MLIMHCDKCGNPCHDFTFPTDAQLVHLHKDGMCSKPVVVHMCRDCALLTGWTCPTCKEGPLSCECEDGDVIEIRIP